MVAVGPQKCSFTGKCMYSIPPAKVKYKTERVGKVDGQRKRRPTLWGARGLKTSPAAARSVHPEAEHLITP